MLLTLPLTLTIGLLAQAKEDPDLHAVRLEVMKAAAELYEIRPVEGSNHPFRLQEEPVLRFNNPLGATEDGGIFLWRSEGDRPAVAAQIFKHRGGSWTHEFTSLSTDKIVGKCSGAEVWRPDRAGVEFQAVSDAPKPAESAEQRLRQMQALAREFVVEDLFKEKSWQNLRMLTKPFARYGKPGEQVTDGALFAYVLTTDPEAFLMLEVRNGKAGPEWHYAFAPMTIYSLKASWKGRQVWELPPRWFEASKPNQPFHFREDAPAPVRRKP